VLRAGLPCRVPYSVMAPFFQRLSASSRLLFVESSHEVTAKRRSLAQKIAPKNSENTSATVNHAALDEQLGLEDAPLSLFTACALKCANISSNSCALGRTKLFFKAGEMGAVDTLLARAALLINQPPISQPTIDSDSDEEEEEVPNPLPKALLSATLSEGEGSGGLSEVDLLQALEARKKAESLLFEVSDLWCGVIAALRRVSNDEVRLYQASKLLSASISTMVEVHAKAVVNDRFKKMKLRAEELASLMNSSLGDITEDEEDSEFLAIAKTVLADAEVVRHAAHKAKGHKEKVSRAVSTVSQQLKECEKLRMELSTAAKWVTNALLVARSTLRSKGVNGIKSNEHHPTSHQGKQDECTDTLEEVKFMDDVLLPTDNIGESVCSLFAAGLRHARHCNSEEASAAARECMTILQVFLYEISFASMNCRYM
jgi:hypothetical protein